MRAWAEQNVWLKHGEKVVPFRASTQPVSGLFLDLFDSGDYSFAFVNGPSQAAKTTTAYTIPTLYWACELGENAVHGIPFDEMVDDKFSELFSVMRQSPSLKELIPRAHRAAKGGTIRDKQTLVNGAELRPMTIGGKDSARAGYPARLIAVTEVKEFSGQATTSVETNRWGQLKARQRSFNLRDRRLIGEGTLGRESELPYSERGKDEEKPISTMTRLLSPCPGCHEGISPERADLVGWRGCRNEEEIFEKTRWKCPKCGYLINNDERERMLRYVVPVHAGQRFDKEHGDVLGQPPRTRTLWFQWKAFHNLLVEQGNVGYDEFRASRLSEGTQAHEDAEKELCLFVHSIPFASTLAENEELDVDELKKRVDEWPRNVVPPGTDKLTVGVDIGKHSFWWLVLASRNNGQRSIVGWGEWKVYGGNGDLETRVATSLARLLEHRLEQGWAVAGSAETRLPDRIWVDGNWMSEAIATVVRNQGKLRSRVRFCRGAGQSTRVLFGKRGPARYTRPKKVNQRVRRIGDGWYEELNYDRRILEYTFDADQHKLLATAGLQVAPGCPGAIILPASDSAPDKSNTDEHTLTTHLANESLTREFEPGEGVKEKWKREGNQHLLDGLAMALGAANECGYRLDESVVGAAAEGGEGDDDGEEATEGLDWGSLL